MIPAAALLALAAALAALMLTLRRRPRRGAYRLIIALRPLAVATEEDRRA